MRAEINSNHENLEIKNQEISRLKKEISQTNEYL